MSSKNSEIRVGIVGFGVVGKTRFECLKNRRDVRVIAVCDQNSDRGKDLASDVVFCSNSDELVTQNLDAVFICLPNFFAAKEAKRFLVAGKHVFCEKPPGRSVNDIQEMRELERTSKDLKLMFGFNHRYHGSVKQALKLFHEGAIGDLVCLRGLYGKSTVITFGQNDWRTKYEIAGGGILLDQGIHLVDLMRLFGGEFNDVKSYVKNSFWGFEVEDNVYAIMENKNGVAATINSSATQWQHTFSLEVVGSLGTLKLNGLLTSSKSYGQETLTHQRDLADGKGRPTEMIFRFDDDPSWQEEVDRFINYVKENENVEMGSSLDALRTMELIFKIYEADNKWVRHRESLMKKYRC